MSLRFDIFLSWIRISGRSMAQEAGDDFKKIEDVARVSANNDETIGRLIAEAMEKVKKEGVITVDEAKGVVPSPASSPVLEATSFTSCAPMLRKGSSSSISRALRKATTCSMASMPVLKSSSMAKRCSSCARTKFSL